MEKIVYLGKISNFVTKPYKSEISSAYYTRYSLGKLLSTVKTSTINNKKVMFIKCIVKVVINQVYNQGCDLPSIHWKNGRIFHSRENLFYNIK